MDTLRLPAAVAASMSLHAGALGLFLYSRSLQKTAQPKIISNVDLLIQTPQSQEATQIKPPAPPTTWNFLKLALPTLPKAAPETMSIKLPEAPKPLMAQEPKLSDRQRAPDQQLKALDLGRSRQAAAQNVNENLSFSHNAQALAALPRLEDVGERQVANLPQALKLDDERRQTQTLQALGVANLPSASSAAQEAPAPLEEAAPRATGSTSKLAALLPDNGLSLAPQERPAAAPAPNLNALPLPSSEGQADIMSSKKKSVDIEGPLASRKVTHYEIPAFPDWAKQEGVLEADVAIRFWVTPDGAVETGGMSVERTSGYGQLDRLAMDFLARWQFAPINTDERQWGVITFRFVLE